MNSTYKVNKCINKPLEFKGLKAQYISYLAIGLVALLLLFALMYLCGAGIYACLIITGSLGFLLFTWVYKYSHKYGRYGLMKKAASRSIPSCIISRSRKTFTGLKQTK